MGLLARRSATDETDEELVDRVRDGSDDAFAELYRRHRKVAERTAAWLLGSRRDVDDAVADAFAAVLQALRNGNGPKENFRAYLLACVRNGCTLRRSRSITPVTLDPEAAGVALEDPERYVEADTVARAFAALSPRWQQALWMTEVEQRSVADVGAQLGLAANAVAALTHRAREGFAQAYLSEHVAGTSDPVCAAVGARLGAYVRGTASPSDIALVDGHLLTCAACRRARDELDDMNASLRSLEGPAAGAAATVATAGVAGITVGGGFAALAGTGALVKVAALALLLTPALAFGAERVVTTPTVDQRQVVELPAAQHLAASDGAGGRPTVVVGNDAAPSPNAPAAVAALPPSTAAAAADIAVAGAAAAPGEPAAPGAPGDPATGDPAVTVAGATGTTVAPPNGVAPAVPPNASLPPISLPPISVPPISVPPIALPGVTLPAITTPAIATPVITTPAISTPAITTPPVTVAVSLPPVTVPVLPLPPITVPVVTVTVPSLTVPPVTVPSVTVPAVTVPAITVPAVTVPSVTVPSVTVPGVTLPPVTIPGLG